MFGEKRRSRTCVVFSGMLVERRRRRDDVWVGSVDVWSSVVVFGVGLGSCNVILVVVYGLEYAVA